MRDDRERMRDIAEAIDRIGKYTGDGRGPFDRDELVQTWMIHNLIVIGEAAGRFTDAFRVAHPEIPWARIRGMRNVLAHHYFGIDVDAVWSAVEHDLPPLRVAVGNLLKVPEDLP